VVHIECNRNATRMQNNKSDPAKMLDGIEPKTKAARIKAMHSLIESKIKDGVQISQIVAILNEAGLDINAVTLKSYLYRLRRKTSSTQPQATKTKDSVDHSSESLRSTQSSTIQDIDSIIHQDPASQANEISKYERLAKYNRRKT